MVVAAIETSPWPFILLMAVGFVVGTAGHVYKSKTAVATGIGLIFLATLVLPAIIYFRDN